MQVAALALCLPWWHNPKMLVTRALPRTCGITEQSGSCSQEHLYSLPERGFQQPRSPSEWDLGYRPLSLHRPLCLGFLLFCCSDWQGHAQGDRI